MSSAFVAVASAVVILVPIVNDWDKLQLLLYWMAAAAEAAFSASNVELLEPRVKIVKSVSGYLR